MNHESVLATLRAGLMDRDRRWSVKRSNGWLVGFTDMLSDATSPSDLFDHRDTTGVYPIFGVIGGFLARIAA